MTRRLALISALIVTIGATSAGIAIAASGSHGDDVPLTGSILERAAGAALAHAGGGKVTETETGDDGEAYEVEILLDDGSQVEVELDAGFGVVGQEADDDTGDGSNEADDDDVEDVSEPDDD